MDDFLLRKIALLRGHWYINSNGNCTKYKSTLLAAFSNQSPNKVLPCKKCSIRTPAKPKSPFMSSINEVLNDYYSDIAISNTGKFDFVVIVVTTLHSI